MTRPADPTQAPQLKVWDAHDHDRIVCVLCGRSSIGPIVEVHSVGREPEQVCRLCAIKILARAGARR